MKSLSGVLPPQAESKRSQKIDVKRIVLPPTIGLTLALLTLKLDLLAVPIVIFLFLILPWLTQDLFRLFIWLIVTWPVLTLYARIPLAGDLPDITHERVLAALILGIIVLAGLRLKRGLPRLGTWVTIYFVAQLISHVAVPWFGGLEKPDVVGFLYSIILPMLMYWATKSLLVSRWHLKRLLYAFILASAIICLSGLYERALGSPENPFLASAIKEQVDTERWMDVPRGRASGVLGNPAFYGNVLGMGVLASLCSLVHAERIRTQAMLSAIIVLLLYGVFVSFTRSAWASCAAALFLTQFLIKDVWRKTLPIFLISILVLILVWGSLADNSIVKNRVLNEANVVGRLERASFAWDRFLEKPLLGWGPGATDILISKRFPATGFTSSHNAFLTLLVDGGLAVFLSFLALLISLLVQVIYVYRLAEKHSFERSAVGVMVGCILIFLLSGLFMELRKHDYLNVLFWISAGAVDRLGAIHVIRWRTAGLVGKRSGWLYETKAH